MVTGRKLLLADDSVTIQKVIDLTFSDEGIEVTTVGNGEQAILKLEEIQPDIVLADIFMPGRSGYEVCEHIKRDERFRHIPVLLLVGSFEPFDEAEARRVGADDYLTKPFQSIRQLVNKVTSLISGGGSDDEAKTRNLEMPEEAAAKDSEAGRGAEDIYTADTAPLPHELADKDPAEVAAHLAGHESLDDELIEMRAVNPAPEPDEPFVTSEARGGESETQPEPEVSFADLREEDVVAASAPEQQPVEKEEPEQFQETIRDFRLLDEMKDEPLSTEPQGQMPGRYISNAAAADEALLDLGDLEPPVSATEADEFILDLQDDAPPQAQPATEPARAEEAQAPMEAEPAGSGAGFGFSQAAATSAHAPQFSEDFAPVAYAPEETPADYAEKSAAPQVPITEEPVSLLTTGEESASQDLSPRAVSYPLSDEGNVGVPESMLEKGFAVSSELAPPTEAAQPSGQITLDQLSPEAIDAIARRAVELLSTKVVEEVAWEVVPQLAELLIKRKLEEEKT